MAIIANTYTTYDAKGIREELSDAIYNISPKETPFLSNVGRGDVSNTFFEWQTDALASAVTTNAQLDGDDIAAFDAVTPTVRLGNFTQISRKTVIISGSEEAVDKAGRKSEKTYQLAKKSAELKRDMESTLLANQGAVTGSTVAARKTGTLLAFIKTNGQFGAGGANPVYTNIPTGTRTDGTPAAFTEAMLKTGMSTVWTQGGKPEFLMVGAGNKVVVSGFAGIATKTYYQSAVEEAAIIGAADVYVSDFGTISIVPNRFQRNRDAFLVDPDLLSVVYLRPFFSEALAKTGDADKTALLVEYGLKCNQEAGLAGIYDLS